MSKHYADAALCKLDDIMLTEIADLIRQLSDAIGAKVAIKSMEHQDKKAVIQSKPFNAFLGNTATPSELTVVVPFVGRVSKEKPIVPCELTVRPLNGRTKHYLGDEDGNKLNVAFDASKRSWIISA